jgi:hypothetical protein
MGLNHVFCGGEIRGVVGAKAQVGPSRSASRKGMKKVGPHDPMLVVAALRPRIRKKHKYTLENDLWRQRGDELSCLGLQEDEVGQLRTVTFAESSIHPVAEQIDADAELRWMCRSVVGQEMPMPGANLERDAWMRREQIHQLLLESSAAGVAMGDEFGGAGGIVHGAGFKTGQARECKRTFNQLDRRCWRAREG